MLNRLLRAGETKLVKRLSRLADHIETLEPEMQRLSDAQLRAKTDEFRARHANGAGESLDELLPEAFAVAREAAIRTIGQRHFPVQLMGGAALHLGNVAEMRTGEGKTLTAVLPAYLNAISGHGVHVVTANDYLAKRDTEWMGRAHRFLGLSVGVILSEMTPEERRVAYGADITYGTNNEFGFDYLRDNMAWSLGDCVQRGHNYAIVDEADSILIDEARTPLIISGQAEQSARWYSEFARMSPMLKRDVHYEVDERKRTVGVTEEGVALVEDQLGIENLYEAANTPLVGYLNNALKSKELFKKDKDYIVRGGAVLIVDEFTGRVLHGRRYNEGMHQAIEAKEGVEIQAENQTLATITLQNYFRLYKKLAGMTGTAQTEASELHQIYKLGVVSIPTNQPMIREDQPDLIYKTEAAKFEAVADDISQSYDRGQPVLVGTTSVEKSEYLAKLLLARGVPHEVLNAKHHEREAIIVARAGHAGSVTVSTNMAGRGTDIMLGGNPEFMADEELRSRGLDPVETPQEYEAAWEQALAEAREQVAAEAEEVKHAGGLYVLGTERHESRRIDNQLRGRSGRQGDPGESRFYLSLGDELMRRFNGQLVESIMNRFNLPDDVPIEAGMVTKAIKSAQTQVEQQNFEIRKNVLKYDEVMNKQRMVIYEERRRVLAGEDLQDQIQHMLADVAEAYVDGATATGFAEDWDLDALWTALGTLYPVGIRWQDLSGGEDTNDITREVLAEAVIADIRRAYAEREAEIEELIGPQGGMRELERQVLLQVLDRKWREHLYEMDYLKEGIGLRAMAQRDPLIEYQREGFDMFSAMLDGLKEETTGHLFNVKVEPVEQPAAPAPVEASQPVEAIEAAPARTKARQRADAQGRAGGRGSTRPAGRHSRAEEPPTQVLPVLGAAGVGSDAPADLQYTGPTEDGTAARMHAGAGAGASGNGGAGGNGGGSGGGNSGRNGGGNASGKAGGNGNRGAARGSAGRAAAGAQGGAAQGGAAQGAMAQGGAEPSRNRPCPCGSGRKYKHCHGSPTGARS